MSYLYFRNYVPKDVPRKKLSDFFSQQEVFKFSASLPPADVGETWSTAPPWPSSWLRLFVLVVRFELQSEYADEFPQLHRL